MSDNILRIICSLFTASVSYFFLLTLCRKIYENRGNVFIKMSVCAAAVVIMQLVHIFQNSYLNFLYLNASSQILCLLLYKTSLKKSLLKNIYYCIFSILGEIISVTFVGIITKNTPSEVVSDVHIMLISCLIYVLIVFLIYSIYSSFLSSKEIPLLRLKESAFIVFLTSFEFFVLYCLTRSNSSLNGNLLIVTILGFLMLNLYAAYIVNTVAEGTKINMNLTQ